MERIREPHTNPETDPLPDFDLCGETPKARACKTLRVRSGELRHRPLAEKLGRADVVELLDQTLKEEKAADQRLTEVTPSIMDRAEARDQEEVLAGD